METKSHIDYLSVIGNTHATAKSWLDAQWNRYYHAVYVAVVRDLLRGVARGTILDVGTSHGHWCRFFRMQGFRKILGVEIDGGRAALARGAGYDEVFNCDAADTPMLDESLDAAVSSDVFVHILKIEDKARVLRKISALLRPGGVFIVNCTSAKAHFDDSAFRVVNYCSFMSANDFLSLVRQHTGLRILDLRPTYYHWRFTAKPLWLGLLRCAIFLPGVPRLLALVDRHYVAPRLGPDASDSFYVKLRK
jgi:SAM-dependent methyltransferase